MGKRRYTSGRFSRRVRRRVPLRGKRPSWRRKYLRGRRGFAKAVKSVILKTAESKYVSRAIQANSAYDVTWGGFAVNHNAIVEFTLINNTAPSVNDLSYIPQGDADSNRNGDEIYSTSITVRSAISIPASRKNTTLKWYLLEYNSVQGTPTTYGDLFHNTTGSVLLDPVQRDRWKLKYLATQRVQARDVLVDPAGTVNDVNINFVKKIPFKRHLCFQKDDSNIIVKGMKERLSLICVAYDMNGSSTLSTCAYVKMQGTINYRDP